MPQRVRTVGASALLLLVLVVAPACELPPRPPPPPVQQEEPARPSLSTEEVQQVLDRGEARLRKADRGLHTRQLSKVFAGFALEMERTGYDLDRQARRSRSSNGKRFGWHVVRVWSTDRRRYPESALVESTVPGRSNHPYRALHHLVRLAAGKPWLVDLRVFPEATALVRPRSGPDGTVTALPARRRVGRLRLDQLSRTLAQALDHPDGEAARRFTGHPRREHFADAHAGRHGRVRRTTRFFPRREVVAMPDGHGGAVAVVALTHLWTERGDRDWVTEIAPPFDKAYPGEYSTLSQASLDTCLVRLPADGRADVRGCNGQWGVITAA
jgi:hypothetical protein